MIPPTESSADWQRLHPATILEILLRQIPQLIFAIVLVLNGGAGGFDGFELLVGLIVLGPAFATYYSARYRLDNERIYYRKGVLQRQSRELPRNQIQSVETSMTIFGRMFGLETLTISTAGGGDSEIEIGLLSIEAADWLRHQLTPAPDLPAPTAAVAVPTIGAGAPAPTAPPTEAPPAPAPPVPETVIAELASGDWWRVFLSRPGLRGIVLAAESFELRAVRFGDRIRTKHGLFRVRTQETRIGRVQGVLADQGIVCRRLGVESLVIDTADASGTGATSAMLVNPIAPAGRWLSLAGELVGSRVGTGDLTGVAPAALRRLRFRAVRRAAAALLPIGVGTMMAIGVLVQAFPDAGRDRVTLVVASVAVVSALANFVGQWFLAGIRFRRHRYALVHDGTTDDDRSAHLAICTGALRTRSLILSVATTQSITVQANWFQRRLGVATVTADTTTRSLAPARITDLTADNARTLAAGLLTSSARPADPPR